MAHPSFEKATVCPFCSRCNELASPASGELEPEDGDFTLCIGCGEWSVFDSRWSSGTRKPTFAEYQQIVANPMMSKARAAWLVVVKGAGHER